MGSTPQGQKLSTGKIIGAILMLAIGIGMIVAAWMITRPQPGPSAGEVRRQRQEFFQNRMLPLLQQEEARNAQAMTRQI